MDPGQELPRLKEKLRQDWRQDWREARPSAVQRLLLLRSLFHSVHQLLNVRMAGPDSTESGIEDGLSALHEALSAWPLRRLQEPISALKQGLEAASDPLELVSITASTKPAEQSIQMELPLVLAQPGREWEALVYLLALHCGWQHRRTPIRLESPAQIQAWLERSKSPTPSSAVLALERDGQQPGGWWVHSVVGP